MKEYSWKQFRKDVVAGIIVGIVALPLAISFGIASGVSPDRGLVTAVVAGFFISVLGGSRVQIGGPTGAFVVIVYSIVQKFGLEGLILATLMAGVIMIVLGISRMGGVIKFIPYPLTVGFTSGIAVIIFSGQIKDFFGLQIAELPVDFLGKWQALISGWESVNPYAVLLGLMTVVILLMWERYNKSIPGAVVALLFVTVLAGVFHFPVETIQSRFGDIPSRLPLPQLPSIKFSNFQMLLPAAFTIAMLGSIESLLSAVIADGMIGGRHRSNTELIGQGIANIFSALFGGMPATGAIARTATNVHNGGRTPVAGIIHAVTLLFILLVFGRWAAYIPLAVLAGILILVAYRMSEWKSFLMILRSPKSDVLVLVVTFFLTVMADLTVAIEVGIILSFFLFVRRLAMVANINMITKEFFDEEERDDPAAISRHVIPNGVEVYEINGPFFFGIVSTFVEIMNNIDRKPRVRILRMRHVLSIDATAINALRQVFAHSRKHQICLILSGIHAQPLGAIQKDGLYDAIGQENVCTNIDAALIRAKNILERDHHSGKSDIGGEF